MASITLNLFEKYYQYEELNSYNLGILIQHDIKDIQLLTHTKYNT